MTASGLQAVEIRYQDGAPQVFFQQNPIQITDVSAQTVAALCAALGITVSEVDARHRVVLASPGANRFLLPLKDDPFALAPNIAAVKTLCEGHSAIGCFVYSVDGDAAQGRMFAPVIGVDEDIINGNSSGCLGAFLLGDRDEVRLRVFQGMAFDRPGVVLVEAFRQGGDIHTRAGGEAVYVKRIPITLG